MKGYIYFIILLSLIVISLLVIYVVREYDQYKPQLNLQYSSTENQLKQEVSNRLSTEQNIVGQINTINDTIYNTLQQDAKQQSQFTTAIDNQQAQLVNALNTALPYVDTNNQAISITNLPGSPQANLQLINKMSVAMGLTAADLNTTGNVNMCNASGKCIKFSENNLNLADIGTTPGKIILDGQNGTQINNNLNLKGNLNLNTGTIGAGKNQKQMLINTTQLGVGNFTSISPQATLHVNTPSVNKSQVPPLMRLTKQNLSPAASTKTSKVFEVTQKGSLNFYNNNTNKGGIYPIDQSNGGPGLKISTPTLNINGNLTVKGLITGNLASSAGPV